MYQRSPPVCSNASTHKTQSNFSYMDDLVHQNRLSHGVNLITSFRRVISKKEEICHISHITFLVPSDGSIIRFSFIIDIVFLVENQKVMRLK